MKKIILLFIGLVFAIGMTGISRTGVGSADSYPSHYLTAKNEVRTVSVNYYDSDSDSDSNKSMDRQVNGYLHSVKNISKYRVNIRSNSVGDDTSDHDSLQVDTIVLTRK